MAKENKPTIDLALQGGGAHEALKEYPSASVFVPDWDFLVSLKNAGRQAAENWLKDNFQYIGKKTSINFDEWL